MVPLSFTEANNSLSDGSLFDGFMDLFPNFLFGKVKNCPLLTSMSGSPQVGTTTCPMVCARPGVQLSPGTSWVDILTWRH